MALIHCPECSKEISSTVKRCPQCGYKIKLSKKENDQIRPDQYGAKHQVVENFNCNSCCGYGSRWGNSVLLLCEFTGEKSAVLFEKRKHGSGISLV